MWEIHSNAKSLNWKNWGQNLCLPMSLAHVTACNPCDLLAESLQLHEWAHHRIHFPKTNLSLASIASLILICSLFHNLLSWHSCSQSILHHSSFSIAFNSSIFWFWIIGVTISSQFQHFVRKMDVKDSGQGGFLENFKLVKGCNIWQCFPVEVQNFFLALWCIKENLKLWVSFRLTRFLPVSSELSESHWQKK